MNPNDLKQLLGSLAEMSAKDDAPKALPEAVVAELKIRAEAYISALSTIPFALGDLVTPRRGATIKGEGLPHIVIDIDPNALPTFEGERGSISYGKRDQVRILAPIREHFAAYWLEAGELEPYRTEQESKAPIF